MLQGPWGAQQPKIKWSTRENNAMKVLGKQETDEAAASVTEQATL